jgi:hypothetical protein
MLEQCGNMWKIVDADARCVTTNGVVKSNGNAVMGRGVAMQARQRYIGVDRELGQLLRARGNHVHKLAEDLVSFPTKNDWRHISSRVLIERSARELVALADAEGWNRVLLPRPGCGAGGLRWVEVQPIIAPILDDRFVVVSL